MHRESNVLAFPKRPTPGVSRAALLTDLQAQEAKGDLRSLMSFAEDGKGNLSFGVTGGFADRLQHPSYALAQSLTIINDRIFASGKLTALRRQVSPKPLRLPQWAEIVNKPRPSYQAEETRAHLVRANCDDHAKQGSALVNSRPVR